MDIHTILPIVIILVFCYHMYKQYTKGKLSIAVFVFWFILYVIGGFVLILLADYQSFTEGFKEGWDNFEE